MAEVVSTFDFEDFDFESVCVWYRCRKCMGYFHTIPVLQHHFLDEHKNEEFLLPGNLPPGAKDGKIYYRRQDDDTQLNSPSNGNLSESEQLVVSKPKQKNIKCEICKRSFSCLSILNFHRKKQHESHVAGLHFNSKSSKLFNKFKENEKVDEPQIVRNQSISEPDYDENQQTSQSTVSPNLISMDKVLKAGSSHVCPRCMKSFNNYYDLARHFIIHTEELPYNCNACTMAFRRKDYLEIHIMKCHHRSKQDAKKLAYEAALEYLRKINEDTESLHSSTTSVATIISETVMRRNNIQPETVQQEEGSLNTELENCLDSEMHVAPNPKHAEPSLSLSSSSNKNPGFFKSKKKLNQIIPSRKLKVGYKKRGRSHRVRKILQCHKCPYQSDRMTRLQNHLKLHQDGSNAVVCPICKWFLSPNGVGGHNGARHIDNL